MAGCLTANFARSIPKSPLFIIVRPEFSQRPSPFHHPAQRASNISIVFAYVGHKKVGSRHRDVRCGPIAWEFGDASIGGDDYGDHLPANDRRATAVFFNLYSNIQTVTFRNGSEVMRKGGSSQRFGLDAARLTTILLADDVKAFSFTKLAANVTYTCDRGWYPEVDYRLHQLSYNAPNLPISFGSSDKRRDLKFWAKNATNSLYAAQLNSQIDGDAFDYAPPRTYDVTLTRNV